MPNHRQTLGTTSTKKCRQVANQLKTRLAANDRRRAHQQALQDGITAGMGTNFCPLRGISRGGAAPGRPTRAVGHLAAPARAGRWPCRGRS